MDQSKDHQTVVTGDYEWRGKPRRYWLYPAADGTIRIERYSLDWDLPLKMQKPPGKAESAYIVRLAQGRKGKE